MSATNFLDFVTEATKEQSKLRLAISGPSGSGKTKSSINILMHMGCERVLVIDTEHGSAAKYSNDFPRKFKVVDDTFWKGNYDPRRLITALKQAGPHFDAIIVDSLTHFWMGPGGMLTLVDQFAKQAQARGGKFDSFGAWKQADPIYNELVQTILALPCHFAACLRAKTEYADKEVNGKKTKVKVGMGAQIREGFEYEFDVEGLMDMEHNFVVGKTRCSAIDGMIFNKPGENLAQPLLEWLTDGVAPTPKVEAPAPAVVAPKPTPAPVPTPAAATSTESTALHQLILASIESAASKEALQALSKEATVAKNAGKFQSDDWKVVLRAFTDKMKTFNNGAAAAQ